MLKKGSEMFKTYFEPVRKDFEVIGQGSGARKIDDHDA
jgi:hypothetical protein